MNVKLIKSRGKKMGVKLNKHKEEKEK